MNFRTFMKLTSIQMGGAICLPLIHTGYHLGKHLPLQESLLAIIVGNSTLCIIGCLMVMLSIRSKQHLGGLIQSSFPFYIGVLLTGLMGIKSFGWYLINLSLMVETITNYVPFLAEYTFFIVCVMSMGMILSTMYGIKTLGNIALIAVPIMFMMLLASMNMSAIECQSVRPTMEIGNAYMLIIGAAIGAAFSLPNYYYKEDASKMGIMSVSVIYLVVVPLIQAYGLYLAYCSPSTSMMNALMDSSIIELSSSAILLFIILAGFTTNTMNLYNAAMMMSSVMKEKINLQQSVIVLAGMGVLTGYINIMGLFETFLVSLGYVFIVLGIYILMKRRHHVFS